VSRSLREWARIAQRRTGMSVAIKDGVTSRIALILWIALGSASVRAADEASTRPRVTVREEQGVYSVAARFFVSQPAPVALAVLTDYDRISQFMPGVETSVVVDRGVRRATVTQEAVSHFMMFSKRIYLTLDIVEGTDTVQFRDRSGKSFARYAGTWSLCEQSGGTLITYELTARPSFDVPDFVLKRLLKRDSLQMIAALRREMEARAARQHLL
jgi:carbon monoxide dehydrogenase subunit G